MNQAGSNLPPHFTDGFTEAKRLSSHKFDNLDEIDQFPVRYNLPKLTQEEIDYLNTFISIKEIESIMNNLPKQYAPSSNGLTD